MASGVDIRIRSNNLPRIRKNLPLFARAAVRKATFDALAGTQTRTPVDTGTLKNSYGVEFDEALGVIQGQVFSMIEYAPYVELGTRFRGAQPHLTPAFEVAGKALQAALIAAARRV